MCSHLLSRFIRLFLPAVFLGLVAIRAASPETTSPAIPSGGKAIIVADELEPLGKESLYKLKTTRRNGSPFWTVETLQDTSPSWAIQLRGVTTGAVKKGEVGLLRFRARVSQTFHETGQGQLRAVVQRAGGDFQRSAVARYDLTSQWAEYFLPVRFVADFEAGEVGVYLGFGYQAQTIELTDLSLTHYGDRVAFADLPRTRVTYFGQEDGAAWRTEAEARIERIRKSDLAIQVVDSAGRPVPAAKVQVEMTRQHFEFGTAVPFALLMNEGPNREKFRETFLSVFNAASPENDLKWPFWAGDRGPRERHRERTLDALRWFKEHEIPVRGHVFVWAAAKRLPKEIVSLIGTPRQKEIPGLVREHIRSLSAATAGLISEWDVLNEPFNNHQLMDLFGNEIMVDWFKTAREALGPDVPLYFNDWGNHELSGDPVHVKHFVDTARFILERGGPVDGLGLQCHIGGAPPSPASLIATLDHYEKELGLPVRVTEFDFTTDDPELHARYSRDFLIAYYSHPSVVGIQFWGFWAKAHWRPQAALFDADWNITPAGFAVRELLRETWWTRAAGETDAAGRHAVRGFHGTYRVRASVSDRVIEQEVRLRPGEDATPVRFVLP